MSDARGKSNDANQECLSFDSTEQYASLNLGCVAAGRTPIGLQRDGRVSGADSHAARSSSFSRRKRRTAFAEPSTLALDFVDRFSDVMRIERSAAMATVREYRTHLHRAESWLRRFTGRTLLTASSRELLRHMRDAAAECELSTTDRLARRLRTLRRFYRWLQAIHARDDDPMADPRLSSWWAQQVRRARHVPRSRERGVRAAVRERNCLMIAVMLSTGLQARDVADLRLSNLEQLESEGSADGGFAPSASLTELLNSYIQGPRSTILAGRRSEYLFPTPSGGPLKHVTPGRVSQYLIVSAKHRGMRQAIPDYLDAKAGGAFASI